MKQFGEDLLHRAQTRRRLAHSYRVWAISDVDARKLDRAMENWGHFYSLMHGARMDLYHIRAWGFYQPAVRIEHRRAA